MLCGIEELAKRTSPNRAVFVHNEPPARQSFWRPHAFELGPLGVVIEVKRCGRVRFAGNESIGHQLIEGARIQHFVESDNGSSWVGDGDLVGVEKRKG